MKQEAKLLAETIFRSLNEEDPKDKKYKNPKTGRIIGYERAKQLGIAKTDQPKRKAKVGDNDYEHTEDLVAKVKGKKLDYKDPATLKAFRKAKSEVASMIGDGQILKLAHKFGHDHFKDIDDEDQLDEEELDDLASFVTSSILDEFSKGKLSNKEIDEYSFVAHKDLLKHFK